jgi:hypothetical protein
MLMVEKQVAKKSFAQPNKSFERTTPASHSVLLLALTEMQFCLSKSFSVIIIRAGEE